MTQNRSKTANLNAAYMQHDYVRVISNASFSFCRVYQALLAPQGPEVVMDLQALLVPLEALVPKVQKGFRDRRSVPVF